MNKDSLEKTLKNLRAMRLPTMADQLLMMMKSNEIVNLSVEEVLSRLSDEELMARRNNTIARLKKEAKLSQKSARLEDIDYRPDRNINKSVINQLRTNQHITNHRNVILLGACGTGKSYIANALGNHSCENFYSTHYCRLFEFIEACSYSQYQYESVETTIRRYLKYDVLILDDFLIHELSEKEGNYLFQLLEYRHGKNTTIICSQREPSEWHSKVGSSLLADSILDRIIPNSYLLVLEGKSLRGS